MIKYDPITITTMLMHQLPGVVCGLREPADYIYVPPKGLRGRIKQLFFGPTMTRRRNLVQLMVLYKKPFPPDAIDEIKAYAEELLPRDRRVEVLDFSWRVR